jgi:hypothetical protein
MPMTTLNFQPWDACNRLLLYAVLMSSMDSLVYGIKLKIHWPERQSQRLSSALHDIPLGNISRTFHPDINRFSKTGLRVLLHYVVKLGL